MQCPNCKSKICDHICCNRCGCDISYLINIKNYSNRLIKKAIFYIEEEKINIAKDLLKEAINLCNDRLARELIAFLNQSYRV